MQIYIRKYYPLNTPLQNISIFCQSKQRHESDLKAIIKREIKPSALCKFLAMEFSELTHKYNKLKLYLYILLISDNQRN